MFFSSDTKNLPQIGEMVCIVASEAHRKPYRILDRVQDPTGQVFIDCLDISSNAEMKRCKVEVFSFWPEPGDRVLIAIKPYLNWLVEQRHSQSEKGNKQALAQIEMRLKVYDADVTDLLKTFSLTAANGSLGVVSQQDKSKIKVPLTALLVAEKSDGRIGR